jgi:hypothetical protein
MLNIALFISGRLLSCHKECLLPFVTMLKQKYNVFVFFSINSFSLDKDTNLELLISDVKTTFGETFGDIYFEEYKFPKSYVEMRINNKILDANNIQINPFSSYNSLSCFYNDNKNMELIEKFEKNNNILFDIICKTRSDIIVVNNDFDFILDYPNELVIRNKHMQDIRFWGHFYNDTPLMISDSFVYGNKISMKHYCSTYEWILQNDLLLKGYYSHAGEIYLTDSILQHVFYKIPRGEHEPSLSKEQIIDKYINNPKGIKIVTLTKDDIDYYLLPNEIRHKNNFIVDINNVFEYTQI